MGLAVAVLLGVAAWGSARQTSDSTYGSLGSSAMGTLQTVLYAGEGRWRSCTRDDCPPIARDWGADALTYDAYLRWKTTKDPRALAVLRDIARYRYLYGTCGAADCTEWSDVPEWDAVAAAREYEATHDAYDLARAQAAFDSVERSDAYAGGACPDVRYQRPALERNQPGGEGRVKTLETEANAVKAALLLYAATHEPSYLQIAQRRYAASRRAFRDKALPLYTVWVLDDGAGCPQVRGRFYASVNGLMIWNGLALARWTYDDSYRRDALATARAVETRLADGRGIFANLQAENDIAEPLVEAMLGLSSSQGDGAQSARTWLLRNAAAAAGARRSDGTYGRFFDGPAPQAPATAWQTSGGLALAIAAAAVDSDGALPAASGWPAAASRAADVETASLPATISFTGSGIALIGTVGERCCQHGHARVYVDGVETVDRTGIWQNKMNWGKPFADSVLFAWRWPASGRHRIEIEPAAENPKEGGTFVHVRSELILP